MFYLILHRAENNLDYGKRDSHSAYKKKGGRKIRNKLSIENLKDFSLHFIWKMMPDVKLN